MRYSITSVLLLNLLSIHGISAIPVAHLVDGSTPLTSETPTLPALPALPAVGTIPLTTGTVPITGAGPAPASDPAAPAPQIAAPGSGILSGSNIGILDSSTVLDNPIVGLALGLLGMGTTGTQHQT